ncbi:MAG: hypothetical protein Q4E62_08575, partial [Sutterellaceae bacterium]|nr:hypothetical protein [Sutterellaceae bacterium]
MAFTMANFPINFAITMTNFIFSGLSGRHCLKLGAGNQRGEEVQKRELSQFVRLFVDLSAGVEKGRGPQISVNRAFSNFVVRQGDQAFLQPSLGEK